MPESPVISRQPPPDPALDFAALREEGIEYLERIVSGLWTDYNAHDPGITLLELLCYGIIDVAHRTTFPDADLFAPAPGEATDPAAVPLVTARHALTCGPVTVDDYRRLLLDRFPELHNVWLDPVGRTLHADRRLRAISLTPNADTTAFDVRGLYRIRALFHDDVDTSRHAELLAAIGRAYHEHRNLAEDLDSVQVTPLDDIVVCAEIQLAPQAGLEETYARVVHALRAVLSPVIPRHSLASLVARGLTMEDIFDGPRLDRGFILADDLARAAAPPCVRASDLMAAISAVPGVRGITRFRLNRPPRDGIPSEPVDWELPIAPGHHPRLTLENARLELMKGPLPFRIDPAAVAARLVALDRADRAAADAPGPFDRAVPAGTWRDFGEFTTLQDALPLTYGVGPRGLDRGAAPERLAKARQLQAFLLLFDQLLAGQLAQLVHVRELLSTDLESRRSYFARAVRDIPDLHRLLAPLAGQDAPDATAVTQAFDALLAGSTAAHDSWIERRSSILDHLLARFGEVFTDQVLAHFSEAGDRTAEQVLGAKRAFLAAAPALAYTRLHAPDMRDPARAWDTDNVSGFEKRLGRLLGFASTDRRHLASVVYEFYEERDTDAASEIRFRIVDVRESKTILSGTKRFGTRDEAEAEMRIAIRLAMDPANYRVRVARDGRHFIDVVHVTDGVEDIVAIRKELWPTRAEAEAERDRVAALVASRFSEEGIFLVESILLRPPAGATDWPLLPASCSCVDASAGEEAGAAAPGAWDPYSFRVHLILPGYTTRLAEPGFRRFVEEIVQRELPAHLAARICFVDREQLSGFEAAYRPWLDAVASGAVTPAVVAPLLAALNALHTVHPAGLLHDFDEDADEAAAIVLDQSSLGSLPPDLTPEGPVTPDERPSG